MLLSSKPENANAGRRAAVEHANRFHAESAAILAEGDRHEVFNAALDFARANALTSYAMARVLGVLRQRGEVSAVVVSDWVREAKDLLGESKIPGLGDALVNEELRRHAATTDWEYATIAEELGQWFDMLNGALFHGRLPRAAISIARAPRRNLGWYRSTRDGLALKHRINLNSTYVEEALPKRLTVLCHEMVHLWEDVEEGRRVGGSYHSKAFRDKAADLGIPTDEHGHHGGITPGSPFARLLMEHGIGLGEQARRPDAVGAPIQVSRPVSRSRIVPWTCGCVPPMRVWAARGTALADAIGVLERSSCVFESRSFGQPAVNAHFQERANEAPTVGV